MQEIKKGRVSTTIHFSLNQDVDEETLDKIIEEALNKSDLISHTETDEYLSEDSSEVA